jgi:chromosome segregation ATPase
MSDATNIDYDLEMQKINDELAALEREKLSLPEPTSWAELTKSGALKKVQEADARRGFIPRLQRAARVRKLELEIGKHEKAVAEMEKRQEEIYEELEPKRQQLIELQTQVNILGGEHTQGLHRIQERQRRIREAQRAINNIHGGLDG